METNTLSGQRYYVAIKPQTDEIHPVHREGCPFMPEDSKRIYLGMFASGNEAGRESLKHFLNSHGCRFCAKESFAGETHGHIDFVPAGSGALIGFLN